jgi:MFS family permease
VHRAPAAGSGALSIPAAPSRTAAGTGHRSGASRHEVQRRTLAVLAATQMLAGVGVAAGVAVGALVAAEVLGRRDLAGLVQTSQVLGAAGIALPAARVSAARGRGPGLALALLIGSAGAVVAVLSTVTGLVVLLLVGSALLGGGTAAGLQARFAGTDLARPEERARALSVVVWSTTVGAVLGPNLAGPAAALGQGVGVDPLAGPYLIAAVALALGAVVVVTGLRPDPLRMAAGLTPEPAAERTSLRTGLRAARASRTAWVGLLTAASAHTVMVAVMVMSPIHMSDGGASITVIGLVVSGHIAGMYALSPVMGWAADRWGRLPVASAGALTLAAAAASAAVSAPGPSPALATGLVLLGLGWSACLVAASAMIADGVTGPARTAVQGTSDTIMSLAAATGGALAGVVVTTLGFATLGWMATAASMLLVGVLLAAARPLRPR